VEITEFLLRKDVQELGLLIIAALITTLCAIWYRRRLKAADAREELNVLRRYRAPTPVREYEDMDEDERLSAQRRAEAQGWLDDYDEEDLERDQQRLSA
jgi:hypothetical protein